MTKTFQSVNQSFRQSVCLSFEHSVSLSINPSSFKSSSDQSVKKSIEQKNKNNVIDGLFINQLINTLTTKGKMKGNIQTTTKTVYARGEIYELHKNAEILPMNACDKAV